MKWDAGRRASASLIKPSYILNPNKAVLTVDSSGNILTINDMTTMLLGDELHQNRSTIFDFLASQKDKDTIGAKLTAAAAEPSPTAGHNAPPSDKNEKILAEEDAIQPGGLVVFRGNVVTLKTYDMGDIAVSMWVKKLPMGAFEEPRWIIVIEPISTLESKVLLSEERKFNRVDRNFRLIFGCIPTPRESLLDYISAVTFPDDVEIETINQSCTGRTKDFNTFPLTVSVVRDTKSSSDHSPAGFRVKIKLMYNISGLLVVDDRGVILQYNHNFTRLLFGYGSSELVGENIVKILPEFDKLCLESAIFARDQEVGSDINASCADSPIRCRSSEALFVDESSKENVTKCVSNPLTFPCDSEPLLQDDAFDRDADYSRSNINNNLNSSKSNGNSSAVEGRPRVCSDRAQDKSASEDPMRDITNSMRSLHSSDVSKSSNDFNPVTSTPSNAQMSANFAIQEGSYFSEAKHKDDTVIGVLYQIREMSMNGRRVFCIWVTWEQGESSIYQSYTPDASEFDISSKIPLKSSKSADTDDECDAVFDPVVLDYCEFASTDESGDEAEGDAAVEGGVNPSDFEISALPPPLNATGGSASRRSRKQPAVDRIKEEAASDKMKRSMSENAVASMKSSKKNSSRTEDPEWVLTNGQYDEHFTIVKHIGRGAFGYVKLSYRNNDGLMVISKFIKKSQIYKDSWTVDPVNDKKTCMEVYLLLKLDHPNIVKAVAAYENEKYFQLVMEKWGCGMDLFEFIERNPALDEPLISYIFRQIVSSLVYLRSLNILHRDIKDENIIINEKFHIKLIDFGSATYLEPDKTFAQFAGTIEYCSPEVLKGQKYKGPELEVWSLGVTLYTLIFGENPFNTVDQVLQQPMVIPITYSENLSVLLKMMMDKDPVERMKLEEVADHPWTNQQVDLDTYVFEEIVRCKPEELNPPRYVSDYGLSEESFADTSSTDFCRDHDKRSSTKDISKTSCNTSGKEYTPSTIEYDADVEVSIVEDCCPETNSESSPSSRSSVTLDSSLFRLTPTADHRDNYKAVVSSSTTGADSPSLNDEKSRSSSSRDSGAEPETTSTSESLNSFSYASRSDSSASVSGNESIDS